MRISLIIVLVAFGLNSRAQDVKPANNFFVTISDKDSVMVLPWNIQEAKFIDNRRVYKVTELMPQFPGGQPKALEFMQKNMKSDPEDDFVSDIKLTFVVDTDGVCKNIGIIKKTNAAKLTKLEISAIKSVRKMPAWKPGMQQGAIVPVQVYLPLTF